MNYALKKNRRRLLIKRSDIITFFLAILFIEIDSFPYIFSKIPGFVYSLLPLALSFLLVAFTLIEKRKISSSLCIVFVLFLWFLFITAWKSKRALYPAVSQMSSAMSLAILTEYNLSRNRWSFFRVLYAAFLVLLAIDISTILLFPKGLYQTALYTNNWFLGYKSARVRAISIPGIAVAAVLSISNYNKLNLKFWLFCFLAIADAALSGATSGSVSLVFYVVILFFLFSSKSERVRKTILKLVNPWIVLILVISLNVAFAILQRFELFEFFITSVLDKDITLTNRTQIWGASLMLFLKSPWVGNGYIVSSDYVLITNLIRGTQPHNLFLAILVYSGLVGLAVYAVLLINSSMQTGVTKSNLTVIIYFGIIIYILFGITSITMFAPFHYAFFVMVYYFSRCDTTKLGGFGLFRTDKAFPADPA